MYRRERAINSRAIYFDGAHEVNNATRGDRIVVGDHDDFSFTDGATDLPFTMTAWVYITDVSAEAGPFISKADITSSPSAGTEFLFRHVNGALQMFVYDSVTAAQPQKFDSRITIITNASVLTDSTWHHLVVTYDGSTNQSGLNFYVDGDLITAVTRSKSAGAVEYVRLRNTTTPLVIAGQTGGTQAAAHAFEQRMADVCIFNKELTASEVAEIYNGGAVKNMAKASTYSNLISWWKMGDDKDNSLSGGIIDYVSGHNGTLTNGATIALEVDLPSDLDPENFEMFTQTSQGKTRQLKFITPPGPQKDYDNILMPLNLNQIETGVAKDLVDTVTYPELANAIPGFRSDPDIKLNGVPCSFSTENQRYLMIFQDCLPVLSNVTVVVWGFSYAMPRWAPLHDTHGVAVKQQQNNAVQLGRIYEIAGVDKVCLVNVVQANSGGQAANRIFDKFTDHISMAVCTF